MSQHPEFLKTMRLTGRYSFKHSRSLKKEVLGEGGSMCLASLAGWKTDGLSALPVILQNIHATFVWVMTLGLETTTLT